MEKFDYTKISDDCVKCGKCKPVCTIFNINHYEASMGSFISRKYFFDF